MAIVGEGSTAEISQSPSPPFGTALHDPGWASASEVPLKMLSLGGF